MTSAVGTAHRPEAAPAGATVQWVYDPWRERPGVAAAALAAALGSCAVVLALREPFLVAAGLCLFCVAAFAPALAPAEVRLDADGAARRSLAGWERRRWSEVRRVDALPSALLLSPFAQRHWLDATRALTLPVPAARRDELLAAVRSHLAGEPRDGA